MSLIFTSKNKKYNQSYRFAYPRWHALDNCITFTFDLLTSEWTHTMLAQVLAVVICVSVCHTLLLHQNGCLAQVVFFCIQTYAVLCSKEIRVSPKIGVFPTKTLFQTVDSHNLALACQLSKSNERWQQSFWCWQHLSRMADVTSAVDDHSPAVDRIL